MQGLKATSQNDASVWLSIKSMRKPISLATVQYSTKYTATVCVTVRCKIGFPFQRAHSVCKSLSSKEPLLLINQ